MLVASCRLRQPGDQVVRSVHVQACQKLYKVVLQLQPPDKILQEVRFGGTVTMMWQFT